MTETKTLLPLKETITEVIGGKPSVIYLMSGGVAIPKELREEVKKRGTDFLTEEDFHSTTMRDPDFADGYKFGYLGGALRVYAVGYLHEYFPEATIITSSTVKGISHADVQERELRALWEKCGIEQPKHLLQEPRSNSTRTELAELIRMIVDNNWHGLVIAVTNDYHRFPRTEATLSHLPQLITPQDPGFMEVWGKFKAKDDVELVIRDAESILKLVDPKFKAMLETVFTKEPWKSYRETRVEAEEGGFQAIEENAYDSQKVRS